MPVRDVLNLRTASAEGIFFGGGDLVAKFCPTQDSMGYSLPGSSVHGILQARILEWVAMLSSVGSSRPRD